MTPTVPPRRRGPNRRLRLGLALGAGIVALLCLGGVGIFVSLYDESTKIERTAPDAVVDSYLRAYLVNRDDDRTALFTCRSGASLADMSTLRAEFLRRESEFGVKVVVTWGSLAVEEVNSTERMVSTTLTIAGTADGATRSRRTESWRFRTIDDAGWRVCGAVKVG